MQPLKYTQKHTHTEQQKLPNMKKKEKKRFLKISRTSRGCRTLSVKRSINKLKGNTKKILITKENRKVEIEEQKLEENNRKNNKTVDPFVLNIYKSKHIDNYIKSKCFKYTNFKM